MQTSLNFQLAVTDWATRCFGGDQVNDPHVRGLRFTEED